MKRVRQKIDNMKQKRASKVDKEGTESGRLFCQFEEGSSNIKSSKNGEG